MLRSWIPEFRICGFGVRNIEFWDTVAVVEAADASEVVAKALHRRPRRQ